MAKQDWFDVWRQEYADAVLHMHAIRRETMRALLAFLGIDAATIALDGTALVGTLALKIIGIHSFHAEPLRTPNEWRAAKLRLRLQAARAENARRFPLLPEHFDAVDLWSLVDEIDLGADEWRALDDEARLRAALVAWIEKAAAHGG